MGSTRERRTGPPSNSDLGTEAQESKSSHKAAQSHWSRGWDEIRTPFLLRHLGRRVSTTSKYYLPLVSETSKKTKPVNPKGNQP